MREERNLKNKSLEDLQKELEVNEHNLAVAERRLNLSEKQLRIAKNKERTHRLILRGVEVERVFPGIHVLTEKEFKEFLTCLSHVDGVREMAELFLENSEYNRKIQSE